MVAPAPPPNPHTVRATAYLVGLNPPPAGCTIKLNNDLTNDDKDGAPSISQDVILETKHRGRTIKFTATASSQCSLNESSKNIEFTVLKALFPDINQARPDGYVSRIKSPPSRFAQALRDTFSSAKQNRVPLKIRLWPEECNFALDATQIHSIPTGIDPANDKGPLNYINDVELVEKIRFADPAITNEVVSDVVPKWHGVEPKQLDPPETKQIKLRRVYRSKFNITVNAAVDSKPRCSFTETATDKTNQPFVLQVVLPLNGRNEAPFKFRLKEFSFNRDYFDFCRRLIWTSPPAKGSPGEGFATQKAEDREFGVLYTWRIVSDESQYQPPLEKEENFHQEQELGLHALEKGGFDDLFSVSAFMKALNGALNHSGYTLERDASDLLICRTDFVASKFDEVLVRAIVEERQKAEVEKSEALERERRCWLEFTAKKESKYGGAAYEYNQTYLISGNPWNDTCPRYDGKMPAAPPVARLF